MKKNALLFVAALLILPLVSFATSGEGADDDSTSNRGEGKGRIRMQQFKENHPGLHCGEFRKEAKTQIGEDRDTIQENRQMFYKTYGRIAQFFGDASDDEKDIIKDLLDETKEKNDLLRKEAFEAYKVDNNTGHIAEAHAEMMHNREVALDTLASYVDADEETKFDTWAGEFLKALEANKSLRLGNVETRTDAHKSCYDKRSDTIIKRGTGKLDKILGKHDGEKQQRLIEKLSEIVEKLIDKTETSDKPTSWKEERISLLESFLVTLGGYLDDLEDNDDDSALTLDDDNT